MKCIDKIIKSINFINDNKEVNKYLVNTIKVLEKLKEYEVDIPYNYEESSFEHTCNYHYEYLESISENWIMENTFNFNGRITNNIQYFYHEGENEFYIAISVSKGGEIKDFSTYTGYSLLKFDSIEDFIKTIYSIEKDNCSFIITVNNEIYSITPHMFSKNLEVNCLTTKNDYDIFANNDAELKEQLQKIKKI